MAQNSIQFDLLTEGIEVGRPAPYKMAHGPDGNFVVGGHLGGKLVLQAFWRMDSSVEVRDRQYAAPARDPQGVPRGRDFLIMSFCSDVECEEGEVDKWYEYILGRGKIDYVDCKRRFIDDSRWWQCTGISGPVLPGTPGLGFRREPQLFLIGPNGKFAAVRIPEKSLGTEISKALKSTEIGKVHVTSPKGIVR